MSDFLKNYADGSDSSSDYDDRPRNNYKRLPNKSDRKPQQPQRSNNKYRVKDDNLTCIVKMRGKPDREYIIPRFDLDNAKEFLHKSTVLYGVSGTGKTITTKHIMKSMQKLFPRVFVFAPTNQETHDYDGVVPKGVIYDIPTLSAVSDIYEYQSMAKDTYTKANNLKILNKLFLRVASSKAKLHLQLMVRAYKKGLKRLHGKYHDPADRKSAKDKLTKQFEYRLRRFYKKVVLPNRNRLKLMRLSEPEQYSLQYLRFSPNVLVVFDDAMTEVAKMLKKGQREENEIIQNFFFRGRHFCITHLYTMQSDKKLHAELRKNTFVSCFTSKSEAMAFFGRSANSFTLEEKKIAEAVIDVIFDGGPNEDDHKKLIYLRDAKSKWQWYKATRYVNFTMCADILWDFCKRVEKRGGSVDKSNKFYEGFAAGLRN